MPVVYKLKIFLLKNSIAFSLASTELQETDISLLFANLASYPDSTPVYPGFCPKKTFKSHKYNFKSLSKTCFSNKARSANSSFHFNFYDNFEASPMNSLN